MKLNLNFERLSRDKVFRKAKSFVSVVCAKAPMLFSCKKLIVHQKWNISGNPSGRETWYCAQQRGFGPREGKSRLRIEGM